MKKKKLLKAIAVLLVLALAVVGIMFAGDLFSTLPSALMISSHTDSAPTLVAHRGLSSIYPQNTIPAFEGAAQYGFSYYELDVHTTKDGEWVVIHDDTVNAMTNGEGEVESFTLEEIRGLSIDGGNGIENHEGLIVPTLSESLDVCEETGILPVIELKKCDVQYLPDLIEMLEDYGLSKTAKIISFDKGYLEEYRKLDSEIDILYLANDPSVEDIDWCIANNFGINFNHGNLYKCLDAIRYAKKQGVTIAAWTVDNTIFADIMVLFGAEYITTNKILP
ncbi:MAG: hypothetical protein IJW86_10915 [Clostridia bacterium]|nr:hypothetical protein [Clostridia bacterium]MBQ7296682.1 hypothetical protein [Clostridia bacterium]